MKIYRRLFILGKGSLMSKTILKNSVLQDKIMLLSTNSSGIGSTLMTLNVVYGCRSVILEQSFSVMCKPINSHTLENSSLGYVDDVLIKT